MILIFSHLLSTQGAIRLNSLNNGPLANKVLLGFDGITVLFLLLLVFVLGVHDSLVLHYFDVSDSLLALFGSSLKSVNSILKHEHL